VYFGTTPNPGSGEFKEINLNSPIVLGRLPTIRLILEGGRRQLRRDEQGVVWSFRTRTAPPPVVDIELLSVTTPIWAGGCLPPEPRGQTTTCAVVYTVRNNGPATLTAGSLLYAIYLSEDADVQRGGQEDRTADHRPHDARGRATGRAVEWHGQCQSTARLDRRSVLPGRARRCAAARTRSIQRCQQLESGPA